MTEKISSSEVSEDILLADDDEERARVAENEKDDVKSDSGLGYSAINTARIALSSILSMSEKTAFGAHPLVCRFLRGVFAERPSLPRYKTIWDVNTVLKYLRGIQINKDLTLRDLTLKLTMLLALLSGQRCQTSFA